MLASTALAVRPLIARLFSFALMRMSRVTKYDTMSVTPPSDTKMSREMMTMSVRPMGLRTLSMAGLFAFDSDLSCPRVFLRSPPPVRSVRRFSVCADCRSIP